MMKKITQSNLFLRNLFFLSVFVISLTANAQLKKSFSPRFSENVNGDITIIANSVLSRHATNTYNGVDGNHDFHDNVFVDIDGDNTTFNSSSANFNNPSPTTSCLQFKKVYIYWAAADKEYGTIEGDDDDDEDKTTGTGGTEVNWDYRNIRVMLPGSSSYQTITADETIFRGRNEHFMNDPYVCIKDITSQVQALSNPYGTFQVANVKATEGDLYSHASPYGHIGTSGGWQIVFIYESPDLLSKNITLFDGYANVSASVNEFNVNFSGFQTVPLGSVDADVIFGSIEGDRDIGGDQLQIRNTSGSWVSLSTSNRNANNFFNSKITLDGTDYTNRNPSSLNTLGFDAGIFELENNSNQIIGNNQTSATIRMTSNQETYGLYLLGFSVQVWEPSLASLNFNPSSGGTNFNSGDIVPMSLAIKNYGNDNIRDLSFTTTIPNEVDLVTPITVPAGVTYTYNTSTRKLVFEVADGLADTNDSEFSIDFDVKIKEQCYFLETACSASFDIQATATFRGELNTKLQTTNSSGTNDGCNFGNHDPTVITINQPPKLNWLTGANDLNTTISCDDTTAINTAQSQSPIIENGCTITLNKTAGNFVSAPSCAVIGTYTNTWTFTDACGRTSDTFTQVITIEDTTDPTFVETLPQNTVAAYNSIPTAAILTANDNCDPSPTVSFIETTVDTDLSTPNVYILVRTWVAKDCAGNETTHTQRIYVTENGAAEGLVINDTTVNEADGTAVFTITFTGEAAGGFTVDYTSVNGSAIAGQDFTAVGTTSVFFNGTHGETKTVTVTINDDNIIEVAESYRIRLSNAGSISINENYGRGRITDNDAATISIADITVDENDGTFNLAVTLNGDVDKSFSLDFATADNGSAISGTDYTTVSGQITFPANSSSGDVQNIILNVTDDSLIEPTETYLVNLSNLTATIGDITFADSQGVVSITDNDASAGTGIAFTNTGVTVTEGTDAFAEFIVTLTGDIAQNVAVDYTTANGSATNPSDYSTEANTITFTPTVKSFTIQVPITDDSLIEPQEQFTVVLSNIVSNIGIGFVDGQPTNTATGTINDDDASAGTGIAFTNTGVTVTEGTDAFAEFIVTLTGDIAQNVAVDYTTANGSATNPSDYSTETNTITFTPTVKSFTIQVPITDDSLIEPQEQFTVVLSNIVSNIGIGFVDGQPTNTATGTINDDDASAGTGIAFTNTGVTVTEGTDAFAEFIVTLTGDIAQNVAVDYTTANGSATNPSDYSTEANTITFTPTVKSFTIQVPITDDSLIEPQEQFTVVLSNIVSNIGIGFVDGQPTNTATGTINDDDASAGTGIAFTNTGVTVTEGTDAFAEFIVTLTGDIAQNVAVDYTTANGSATNPSDYTTEANTITFTPTVKSFTIQVPITDDSLIEPQEQFTVILSNIVSNIGIGFVDGQPTNTATGTINDDDASAGTGIAFTNTGVTVTEGTDAFAEFIVTLTGDIAQNVAVDYTTANGSATNPSDYTTETNTITFTPSVKSFTIQVPITDDSLIEPQEQFTVVLSNIVSNIGIGFVDGQPTNTATGTINDDDASAGTGIAFTNTGVTVTEGTDAFAEFIVTLTGDIAQNVAVDYTTVNGSATNPSDYSTEANTITFTPTVKSFTIQVPITDDSLIEPQEQFTVVLSNIVSNIGIGFVDGQPTNTATGTINDDDASAGTGIAFTNTGVTVTEGTDAFAEFIVTLTGDIAQNVAVDYTTANGSATNPSDYTTEANTITFTPTVKSFTIQVPITDDSLIEPQEQFTVVLSNIVSNIGIGFVDGQPTNTATGTINDDDASAGTGIAFTNTGVTVTEGTDAFAEFIVTLTGDIAQNVAVDYTTANGSATNPSDYTTETNTITFTPSVKSFTIQVPITDDSLIEPQEQFTVVLSNIVSNIGIGFVDGQPTNTATATINDDDASAGTGIAFTNTGVTVTEGTDAFAEFIVTLTGDIAQNVAVDYTTANGSATNPSDYTTETNTITFTPSVKSFTIQVPITDDSLIEPQEQFTVVLSNIVSNIGIGFVDGQPTNTATATINDDDASAGTGIAFTNTGVTVTEGTDAFAEFIVTLTGDIAQNVAVDYTTVNGSATNPSDYSTEANTITFTPTVKSFTIQVPITDDSLIEPQEQFTVVLSNIVSNIGIGFVDGQPTNTATGTINDDDASAGTGIAFTNTGVTVTEGTDAFAEFIVTLTGDIAQNVAVDYTTANGSATNPSDYTTEANTITFTPTVKSFTIQVPITDDSLIEPQEQFTVVLSNIVSNIGIGFVDGQPTNTATGTINDDDASAGTGIAFTNTGVTVTEGTDAFAEFIVTLTGDIAQNVAVDYTTANGSATNPSDYTTEANTITFTPTVKSFTIQVPITDDSLIEPQEQFIVVLSNIVSNIGIGFVDGQPTNTATGTINDDDASAGTGIAFTNTGVTVTEGTDAFAEFIVTLTGDIAQNVAVDYTTANGSATNPSDYSTEANTITFTPTVKSFTIQVPITDDSLIEPQEQFTVVLSNIVSNIGIGFVDGQPTNTATGTINDNDASAGTGIAFTNTGVTVTEGTDAFAEFIVTLTGDIAQNVAVDYTTANGSATNPSDYTTEANTITFTPTVKSFTIQVPITDDSLIEPQEQFTVVLSNIVSNIGIGFVDGQPTNTATATINDDDASAGTGIAFTNTGVTVTEGTDAFAEFIVTLTGDIAQNVAVDYTTANGSATNPSDYTTEANTITFTPTVKSFTIQVPITDDSLIEPQEQFTVVLSNIVSNIGIGFVDGQPTNTATATINDDDASAGTGIAFTNTGVTVTEGTDAFAEFIVTLTGDIAQNVAVDYTTVNGSATNPSDYSTEANTITFTPTVKSFTIQVPITDDSLIEPQEQFTVVLSNIVSNIGIGFVDGQPTNTATGTINDDDASAGTGIAFTNTGVTVTEGTDAFAEFIVTLTGDIAQNVAVDYTTANGSATNPSDYTTEANTITFTPTVKSFTIQVPITDDSLIEPQEQFTVVLSNIVSNIGIGFVDGQPTNTATGTINDDDASAGTGIAFTNTGVTVTEGTDAFAEFIVTLTGDIAQNVAVDYTTANGSATNPSDYTTEANTITFTPTVKSFTIQVPITDDSLIEPQEQFIVVLSNIVSNIGIGFVDGQPTNTATGTINDDDASAGTGIAFTNTGVTVTEGTDAFAEFIVTLTGDIAQNVAVDYTTANGSATNPSDYSTEANTITFTPTVKSFTIQVPITDDSLIEPQEQFTVVLSNIVSNIGIGFVDGQPTNTATGTINDNDASAGTGIAFTNTGVTVTEGTDAFAEFIVTLTGDIAQNVAVDYTTANGSATNPSDYTTEANTITFTPTVKSFTIQVPITDDSLIEPQEQFTVVLSNIVSNIGIGFVDGQPTNTATATINDDDASAGTGIAFTNTGVTVTEGTDAFAEFIVTLTGDIAQNVAVDYTTANGSATNPSDYTTEANTITFTPTVKSFTIQVPITDDSLIEPQEQFTVVLSNIVSNIGIGFVDGQPTNTATATINDDDASAGTGIAFTNTGVTVTEGTDAFAEFIVTLTGDIAQNVAVDYTTVNGSATNPSDYSTEANTITFTPTVKSFTIQVPITDDSLIEPQEQFTVVLSNIVSNIGIGFVDGQPTNTATGTINDDDASAGTGIAFTNTGVTVTEGTDAFAEFIVTLTGDIAQNVAVDYTTANGSATNPSDYTTEANTITFTPTVKSFTIQVPITDDSLIEPQEQFTVVLSNIVSNIGIGFVDGQPTNTATGTINDDDASAGTGIAFTNTGVTVTEGTDAFAEFIVTLTGDIAQNVAVDYTTANGSATNPSDYTTEANTITFTPTVKSFTIQVPITDDSLIEPQEQFTVVLSNIVSNIGIGFVDGQPTNTATGTINDDDASAGTGIAFTNTGVTVTEGTDAFAEFIVTLTGDIAQNVAIDYTTANGSATNPSDYSTEANTITFTPTVKSFTIQVPITDDSLIEPQEQFTVVLSNIVSNIGIGFVDGQPTNTATGTINDNDASAGTGIAFTNTGVTVTEGTDAFAEFIVTLTGDIAQNVAVDYTTANGSATNPSDYTTEANTITFTPTVKSFTIQVPITDDSLIEPQEQFTVVLSNIVSNIGIGFVDGQPTNTATATINDDDASAGTGIAFTNTGVTVTEGTDAFAEFIVTLTGDIAQNVAVDYTTANGSATNPSDYTTEANTITFTPTVKSFTIQVPITDDSLIEPQEQFTVVLSNIVSNIGIGFVDGQPTNTATGTINDDDASAGTGIAFTNTGVTVTEGTDAFAEFIVTLTGDIAQNVAVDYTTANGSATNPSDYTTEANTITFTPTVKSFTIQVPITDDSLIEPQEQFTVVLSNIVSNIGIGFVDGQPTNTATGTINDDDASAGTGIAFTNTGVTVTEGTDAFAEFIVTLTGDIAQNVAVDYTTANGSATNPSDYTTEANTITFTPTVKSFTIQVPITDDSLIEPQEQFTVVLSNIVSNIGIGFVDGQPTNTATGTINDDDFILGTSGLVISPTQVSVDEDAGTATFTVVLTGNTQDAFSVDFTTTNGSAIEPGDYVTESGTLNFAGTDGETKTITVNIIDDIIIETQEDYTIVLSNLTTTLIPINVDTAVGRINDNDSTATYPQDITVECDAIPVVGIIPNNPTCNLTVVFNEIITGQDDACATEYTITRTWTITDCVANEITHTQTITVEDNTAPIFTGILPADSTVSCDAVPNAAILTATDNCALDADIVINVNDVISGHDDACAAEYTITRTWTASDCAGNTTTHTQVITVEDTTAPTFTGILPTDITVSCDAIPVMEVIPVADTCDSSPTSLTIVTDEQITDADSCSSNYIITRIWMVTDCAGNFTRHTQTITVEDTTAPVFVETLPTDNTVTCDNIPEAATLTATDNCDANLADVNFTETTTNNANCALGYQITRTWTIADCAGNTTTHSQTLTITSSGGIKLKDEYQTDIAIMCGDAIPEVPELEFTGGCGNYSVVFEEESTFTTSSEDYMIVRTWTVTDSCNNVEEFQQFIHITQLETVNIALDVCVEEIEVDLEALLPDGYATDGTYEITKGDAVMDDEMFQSLDLELGEYIITYTAINDTCANNVEFTITIHDECVVLPCGSEDVKVNKTITPNGDNINDVLIITGVEECGFTYEIKIFNRWGTIVYEDKNYQNNWGATSPNGSIGRAGTVPSGTYYYMITLKDSGLKPINGYIYISAK